MNVYLHITAEFGKTVCIIDRLWKLVQTSYTCNQVGTEIVRRFSMT